MDSIPGHWYLILVIVIATPLYFLLGKPRKRKQSSRWKG